MKSRQPTFASWENVETLLAPVARLSGEVVLAVAVALLVTGVPGATRPLAVAGLALGELVEACLALVALLPGVP